MRRVLPVKSLFSLLTRQDARADMQSNMHENTCQQDAQHNSTRTAGCTKKTCRACDTTTHCRAHMRARCTRAQKEQETREHAQSKLLRSTCKASCTRERARAANCTRERAQHIARAHLHEKTQQACSEVAAQRNMRNALAQRNKRRELAQRNMEHLRKGTCKVQAAQPA